MAAYRLHYRDYGLGLDHRKFVTDYQRHDFRLTDVGGNVVQALLA